MFKMDWNFNKKCYIFYDVLNFKLFMKHLKNFIFIFWILDYNPKDKQNSKK